MNKMKIGVLADSFRLDTRQAIAKAMELGAEGVQLYAVEGAMAPWNMPPGKRRELLDFVKSQGLVVSALCGDLGGYGFTCPAENPIRIERSKQIMDLARDLDCRIVTTHIGVIPADPDHPRRAILREACEKLGTYADQAGAIFAIETGPETAGVLKGFLDSLSCHGVRVNLDPANLLLVTGDDAADAAITLGSTIVHTHAKDGILLRIGRPEQFYTTYGEEAEVVDEAEYGVETPLGEGQVDFDRYLEALAEIGYDGFLTIEREVGEFPEKDIRMAVRFLEGKLQQLGRR